MEWRATERRGRRLVAGVVLDLPNDGEGGEGDNVHRDVENINGGSANDVLVGSAGPNRIFGFGGDDQITGGGGPDLLRGGDGGDQLFARDLVADDVGCGTGSDIAQVDAVDLVGSSCGTVDRAAAPPGPTPPDTSAPTLAYSGVPSKVKYKDFVAKGVVFKATPSEASTLAATLYGAATKATVAKKKKKRPPYNVVLATKNYGLSAAKRSFALKPSKSLLGKSKAFTVRISILVTDAAHNRRTTTKDVKIVAK
jgi:RTX calcium-binding nonapeptide repeat (4 copies)